MPATTVTAVLATLGADGSDPRLCPNCGTGRLALRGGKFGAFVACSNYPECRFTQKFGAVGEGAARLPVQDGRAGAGPFSYEPGADSTIDVGRYSPVSPAIDSSCRVERTSSIRCRVSTTPSGAASHMLQPSFTTRIAMV